MIVNSVGWNSIIERIKSNTAQQSIYVIGKSNSGKTTFCNSLIECLLENFKVGYIDCDPGQSVIGPPSTIGLSIYETKNRRGQTDYLYFIGSVSPKGHMLQMIGGIKKLTDKAREVGCQKIVFDSSGFVIGEPAREFQFYVIDIIQPEIIVSFQERGELESILKNFDRSRFILPEMGGFTSDTKIYRLTISKSVVLRNMMERKLYREEKFRKYFKLIELSKLNLEYLGMHGIVPDLRNQYECQSRLIALCDLEGFVITLGIIDRIDNENRILHLFSPPFEEKKVHSVQFGSIYLSISGREINRKAVS